MNASEEPKQGQSANLLIGKEQCVLSGSSTLVGRAATNDVLLDDESVSAHHAVIKCDDLHYTVVDLGSTNGTFINGERVTSAALTDHDLLTFGSVETIVQVFAPIARKACSPTSSVCHFHWWPQNRIISFLAAGFFALLFIFNAAGSPFAAVFIMAVFYMPMTGIRYVKFWLKRRYLSVPTESKRSLGWWPALGGMALCSLIALFCVAMAISGTNSERDQVAQYAQANQTALDENNSVGNYTGLATRTGINLYNGDYITPVVEGVEHLATNYRLEQNVAAAQAYERNLTAARQGDGGVMGLALLLLAIPLFYAGWRLVKWYRHSFSAVTSFIIFLAMSCLQAESPTGISLENNWLSPMHGGATAMKELASLLSPVAKSAENLLPAPDLKIYQEVTYLMPLLEAKQKLNLGFKMAPKNKIITAGFPKDSLFHHCFDGIFEAGYSKLYLITDKADQVVAVQLMSEAPRRDQVNEIHRPTDWSMYNFVSNRRKGTSRLWASHEVYFQTKTGWRIFNEDPNFIRPTGDEPVMRLDSVLIDPAAPRGGYRTPAWKAMEASRLYLPRPLVETILYYISANGAK